MNKLMAAGLAVAGAVAIALAPVASADNNNSNNSNNPPTTATGGSDHGGGAPDGSGNGFPGRSGPGNS